MMYFGLARAGLGALSYDLYLFVCPCVLRASYSKMRKYNVFRVKENRLTNPLIVIKSFAIIFFFP